MNINNINPPPKPPTLADFCGIAHPHLHRRGRTHRPSTDGRAVSFIKATPLSHVYSAQPRLACRGRNGLIAWLQAIAIPHTPGARGWPNRQRTAGCPKALHALQHPVPPRGIPVAPTLPLLRGINSEMFPLSIGVHHPPLHGIVPTALRQDESVRPAGLFRGLPFCSGGTHRGG